MATYKNGIAGTFSGKVGPVVGSNWNGIDYMRSLPRKSSRPPTERQKAQRLKMSIAISFLSPVSELVNVGFKTDTSKKSGFNEATSHIIQEAIVGTYPDFALDYSHVLISSGNLTGAWNAEASSASAGLLTVRWTDNSGSGTAKSTDQAIVLVYNPAGARYVYDMEGAGRGEGEHTMTLPSDFSGDAVEVWVSFRSVNRQRISTSIYAGRVLMA